MPVLETYDDLKKSVADWLARPDDEELIAKVPEFIRLAEAKLDHAAKLRVQETRATAMCNGEFEWLPADVTEVRSVFWLGVGQRERRPLRWLPAQELATTIRRGAPAAPQAYTLIGNQIQFAPFPDGALLTEADAPYFEIIYRARVRPLSDEWPANDVLLVHPDIYLYGTLLQAAPYIMGDQRIPVWDKLYSEAVAIASERTTSGNRGAVTMRPR